MILLHHRPPSLDVHPPTNVFKATFYRHWTGRIQHTEGVQYLAEAAGGYWLVDVVTSYQHDPRVKQCQGFQIWELTVNLAERTGVVTLRADSMQPVLIHQALEHTDFPLERVAVGQGGAVLIPPGMRHRAARRMKILNVVVARFDPADEWFDGGRNVYCSGHTGPAAKPVREPARKSSKLIHDLVTPSKRFSALGTVIPITPVRYPISRMICIASSRSRSA
jgi:hypothetical protein